MEAWLLYRPRMFKAHELHVGKHSTSWPLILEWVEIRYLFRDFDCLKRWKAQWNRTAQFAGFTPSHSISPITATSNSATRPQEKRKIPNKTPFRPHAMSSNGQQASGGRPTAICCSGVGWFPFSFTLTGESLCFCGHSASDSFSSINWFCSRLCSSVSADKNLFHRTAGRGEASDGLSCVGE